jgi:DNA-binding response OmpR family regulator
MPWRTNLTLLIMNNNKIVLAEDNTTLSLLLKFRLEKEGFELFMAKDGNEAVSLIEKVMPDLIITDIMMPFISGLEVISHVRNKLESTIPIIVFSAAGQEEMVLKAFSLGANDFMGKPFSPNELMIRVKRLLPQLQPNL